MKRMVSAILALVCLLALAPAASAAGSLSNFKRINTYENNFTDVSAAAWYAESVSAAYELGLMKGSAADKFNPDGSVTIAEALAMACRIHDLYNGGEGVFEQGSPWYQVYVDYALAEGILTFTPESYTKKATRSEFAAILSGALPDAALKGENKVDDGMIPDVSLSNSHYEAIYRLYRAGILTGNDAEGTFTPDSTIARNAAAAIVTRMADESLRKEITLTMDALYQPIEGSDVSWYFQKGTGTLYLKGKGGFAFVNQDQQPWKDWRADIKAAVIEEGITEVGSYAFCNCSSLASVSFPDGLKTIGSRAFTACALTDINFPKTLRSMGSAAFSANKQLTRVDLRNTKITVLEGSTFSTCNISGVALPDTLERIEYQVFMSNCIERVVLPENVTYVGELAFNDYDVPVKEVYILGDELPELDPNTSGSYNVFAKGTDFSHVTIYFGGDYFYNTQYSRYNVVDGYDMSDVDAGLPAYVELTGFTLSPATLTLFSGQGLQLGVTYLPEDASDKGLIWTSSNPAVATVNSRGRVDGKTTGTAVITATAFNGLTSSCTVTVKSAADYAYLVSSDFRGIRRDYSSARALNGYAYAYNDKAGDLVVLTYVQYKIGNSSTIWSDFFLHNMSKGTVISDPAAYYDKVADRYYGANKIYYMDLASEVRGYQIKALNGVKSVLSTGVNSEAGAYVSAATMNK